jgi:hypothetical protein
MPSSRPCTVAEEQQLGKVHESLGSASALASGLHCSYCAAGELDDPARLHLTWAHEEFMHRRVTPVTRRELHDFGLVLYGEAPAALLPPVTGGQLAEFVVQDLESFWLPSLDHPERWDRDIMPLAAVAHADGPRPAGRLLCESSVTVSRSGHFAVFRRLRNSVSSAAGTFTRNGRTAVWPLPACRPPPVMTPILTRPAWRRSSAGSAVLQRHSAQ